MQADTIHVLLIDDDEDDYVIIRDLLTENHDRTFQLDWSASYEAGLAALLRRAHDVCLLDYRLGEQTGVDLLQAALRQGCQLPMILLTGRGDSEVDAMALNSGAADYLVKGQIGHEMLARSIRYALKHKAVELELRSAVENLKRSNKDLEDFAYVASHELKEPLGMVVSYLELLEQRHTESLKDEAREFMGFAVGAATRLRALINDLLAYSRVSIRGKPFAPVNCEQVLSRVLEDLGVALRDSGARVTHEPLPSLLGEEGQLVQVFQNLVGNAIKFRGKEPPRVHVSAELQDQHWLFQVRDNGIGIDARYSKRLFQMFQRLHNRAAYPGTGIGLAVTKRIVERHGGRIWFESEPGQGTSFYFTLPSLVGAHPPSEERQPAAAREHEEVGA